MDAGVRGRNVSHSWQRVPREPGIIQSVDWLFYQPGIAANLSSATRGGHLSLHLFAPFVLPYNALFLSVSRCWQVFFSTVSRRAHREIRAMSDEGFTSSSSTVPFTSTFLSSCASPPFLPALVPLKFCRRVVYPTRGVRFYADSGPLSLEPVVGDATTPMQKTQRDRPHLILEAFLSP